MEGVRLDRGAARAPAEAAHRVRLRGAVRLTVVTASEASASEPEVTHHSVKFVATSNCVDRIVVKVKILGVSRARLT